MPRKKPANTSKETQRTPAEFDDVLRKLLDTPPRKPLVNKQKWKSGPGFFFMPRWQPLQVSSASRRRHPRAVAAWAGIAHAQAVAVGEEPRSLTGHAERTVELVSADALLRRAQQISSGEPFREPDFGRLEHGSDRDGELLAAQGLAAL